MANMILTSSFFLFSEWQVAIWRQQPTFEYVCQQWTTFQIYHHEYWTKMLIFFRENIIFEIYSGYKGIFSKIQVEKHSLHIFSIDYKILNIYYSFNSSAYLIICVWGFGGVLEDTGNSKINLSFIYWWNKICTYKYQLEESLNLFNDNLCCSLFLSLLNLFLHGEHFY